MTKIWDYVSKGDDNLSIQVEKDPNIVMTNPTMAIELLKRIPFEDDDIVLEPALGSGSFYNNFPINTTNIWCEINKGVDFLEWSGEDKVDYTISNPPYVPRKLFWSFHLKAMEITRKGIYWLINLSSLNVFTTKRLGEMGERGWYIQSLHIVNDKRWFGRYAFIHISRGKNNFITYDRTTY